MKRFLLFIFLTAFTKLGFSQRNFLIEAEQFSHKGGWVVDPQFTEQMGSPYLMAHGLGIPVENAKTEIEVNVEGNGIYHVWARTKNWAFGNWEPPGRFQILVNGKKLQNTPGKRPDWGWEYVGSIKLNQGENEIELHDLTGFNGRCDAIYFGLITEGSPPEGQKIIEWRKEKKSEPVQPETTKKYDLVITGGGLAGCAAAIAASEEGLKVALIHDRPFLGGNASQEIRVHTLGIYGKYERILKMIDTEHYPNGSADAKIDQQKRDRNMKALPNVDLFLNWRAYDAVAVENMIQYVDARHTSSGERIRFEAPLFTDATGDGWIGFWAGAEYSYGRESVNKYGEAWDEWGELWSPEEPDNFVMGSSVLWGTEKTDSPQEFPEIPWASEVAKNHSATAGEWYWEFSRNDLHQIEDGEEIRDHLLKAIFGSFSNAKKDPKNANYRLKWVSYLLGKRESRRLIGDHVFTFKDVTELTKFPDSVVIETREIDVHFQQNLENENMPDFLSKALFYHTPHYIIPYRSLYSKNINNLFMAGRCFSCSHVGLGGPRVMRTTGQMGAAVGFAASICKKYGVNPRQVYTDYLKEYMRLIEEQQWRDSKETPVIKN